MKTLFTVLFGLVANLAYSQSDSLKTTDSTFAISYIGKGETLIHVKTSDSVVRYFAETEYHSIYLNGFNGWFTFPMLEIVTKHPEYAGPQALTLFSKSLINAGRFRNYSMITAFGGLSLSGLILNNNARYGLSKSLPGYALMAGSILTAAIFQITSNKQLVRAGEIMLIQTGKSSGILTNGFGLFMRF